MNIKTYTSGSVSIEITAEDHITNEDIRSLLKKLSESPALDGFNPTEEFQLKEILQSEMTVDEKIQKIQAIKSKKSSNSIEDFLDQVVRFKRYN